MAHFYQGGLHPVATDAGTGIAFGQVRGAAVDLEVIAADILESDEWRNR